MKDSGADPIVPVACPGLPIRTRSKDRISQAKGLCLLAMLEVAASSGTRSARPIAPAPATPRTAPRIDPVTGMIGDYWKNR